MKVTQTIKDKDGNIIAHKEIQVGEDDNKTKKREVRRKRTEESKESE